MADRLISVPAARSHINAVVADPILKACMHNVLDAIPAVDAAEVVHGRWAFAGLWEECSVCKHPIAVDEPRTNFCPNCGAKMDLEV